MKGLISHRTISVVTATIILGMIMSSAALITPASADRLTENPDIHQPEFWARFHNFAMRGIQTGSPKEVFKNECVFSCRSEAQLCVDKWKKIRNDKNQYSIISRDCGVLAEQCIAQECRVYE